MRRTSTRTSASACEGRFARRVTALVRASLIVSTMALSSVSGYAASPYSWATYYATQSTRPITIDGDLSEWSDVPGFTMDQEKFFYVGQGMSSAKWTGAKDLAATFRVQWDEQYLYLAIQVTDDKVTEPHGSLVAGTETGSWDDDGVEVMLDGDGCCATRYYIGDLIHHELHFVYSARHPFVFDNFWKPAPDAPRAMFRLPDGREEPLSFAGEFMAKNDVTAIFSQPPYNGKFAFKRTATGYNLEIRMVVPGATMAPINSGGHPIGFDIAINDNDAGTGPLKQQLHWSGMNGLFWRDTGLFGTLVLIRK
jgi:Carbohydrate family 9 binding domain-like